MNNLGTNETNLLMTCVGATLFIGGIGVFLWSSRKLHQEMVQTRALLKAKEAQREQEGRVDDIPPIDTAEIEPVTNDNIPEQINSPDFSMNNYAMEKVNEQDLASQVMVLDDVLALQTHFFERKFLDESRILEYTSHLVDFINKADPERITQVFEQHLDWLLVPTLIITAIPCLHKFISNTEIQQRISSKANLRGTRIRFFRLFGFLGIDQNNLDLVVDEITSPRILNHIEEQKKAVHEKLLKTTQTRGFATLNFKPRN